MLYRPSRALGLLVGSVLTLWAAGVAILLFDFGVQSGIGILGFLAYAGAAGAAVLAAMFGYWSYALWTLAYELDRNALVVTWGLAQQVIPLDAIERLVPGTEVDEAAVRGVTWWGCHVGRAETEAFGQVLVFSTAQVPDQVLYVVTGQRTYALTVEDPANFARQVVIRQQLGPTTEVEHHARHIEFDLLSIIGDRVAIWLAALAVATGTAVWVQIAVRYGSLPETFHAYFPPGGDAPIGELAGPSSILEVPQAATALLVTGLIAAVVLHRWERMASRLVLGVAAFLQAIFIAATAIAIG
ncbi:MAG: PH domain-containing protein [Chloroflexi bacterium]|nr:PH domain-containing protein [Chloroflexota bacterium]